MFPRTVFPSKGTERSGAPNFTGACSMTDDRKKILIMDDDKAVRDVTGRLLSFIGYDVG